MTLTCNKKAYSEFKEVCEKCPEYDECVRNGKFAFVELAQMPSLSPGLAPASQDNTTFTVHVDSGFSFDIHRSDVEKSIKEQFNPLKNMFMNGA